MKNLCLKLLLHYFILYLFVFNLSDISAQGIAINADGASPDPSAGLDIQFTDKGVLVPRVDIDDVNNSFPITLPAKGLLVYNENGIEPEGFYYWDGDKWIKFGTENDKWSLTGNKETLPGTHFIGTTDNIPLIFKINNEKAGRIGNANDANVLLGYQAGNNNLPWAIGNVGIGFRALNSNTEGSNNIALGYDALFSNTTGKYNIASGTEALYSNTEGEANIAMGTGALYSNLTGNNNLAFGQSALHKNTTGRNNIAFEEMSLFNNTTGYENIAIGISSLSSNETGIMNLAIGPYALRNHKKGTANIALGYVALSSDTAGHYNIAAGHGSMDNKLNGSNNVALGVGSLGYKFISGDNNVAVGRIAGRELKTGNNNIMIGNNAQVPDSLGSNQVRIGNATIGYAGIQIAWTITSDSRYKKQIQNIPLGLNFINELRPVVYNRKNNEKDEPEYGFIAQEVEEVLQKAGVKTQGLITRDYNGYYGIRYNDFIAISVKAIQELEEKNSALQNQLDVLNERLKNIETLLETSTSK